MFAPAAGPRRKNDGAAFPRTLVLNGGISRCILLVLNQHQ